MKEYPEITAKEMEIQLHVTEDGTRFHIKNMKKEGILKRIGSTKKRRVGNFKIKLNGEI